MENFTYFCPTKAVFGKGSISELSKLIPPKARVLITYGGGSIKKNGVHAQVIKALQGYEVLEFGGIEPNPRYETCMKAVEIVRQKNVDFLLAVGGGSVLDGTKFIAAASKFSGSDPWDIVAKGAVVSEAVSLGTVLTLPATGSEMNPFSVMSRNSTNEKLAFSSDLVRPLFAVLDPETTFSLPQKQVANGIVDTYVHVMEQYMTFPADAPLQDRQAEAILQTLIECAPKVKAAPADYSVRATLMWCATQALNQLIGCGVPQDWTTHALGHELTALYGVDHGQSLAIVMPGVLQQQRANKKAKLVQYAERVWQVNEGNEDYKADVAIKKTEEFFRSVGVATRLSEYNIPEAACNLVAERIKARAIKLGERENIGPKEVAEILALRK